MDDFLKLPIDNTEINILYDFGLIETAYVKIWKEGLTIDEVVGSGTLTSAVIWDLNAFRIKLGMNGQGK